MQPHEEMACNELVEVITDYIEGTMAPRDRERFEAHLDECPYCVNYVEQMRSLIGSLGKLEREEIPEAAKRDLLEAFRGWKG